MVCPEFWKTDAYFLGLLALLGRIHEPVAIESKSSSSNLNRSRRRIGHWPLVAARQTRKHHWRSTSTYWPKMMYFSDVTTTTRRQIALARRTLSSVLVIKGHGRILAETFERSLVSRTLGITRRNLKNGTTSTTIDSTTLALNFTIVYHENSIPPGRHNYSYSHLLHYQQ